METKIRASCQPPPFFFTRNPPLELLYAPSLHFLQTCIPGARTTTTTTHPKNQQNFTALDTSFHRDKRVCVYIHAPLSPLHHQTMQPPVFATVRCLMGKPTKNARL